MLDSLTSLLALSTIALAAFGLGRPVLRKLGVGEEDALSIGVWSIALGLSVGGLALTLFGLIGVLYSPVIAVATLAAGLWGLAELAQSHLARQDRVLFEPVGEQQLAAFRPEPGAPGQWLTIRMAGLAGCVLFGSLISALAPPTACDAMCYHLELPKRFLELHALVYLPDSDNSTYPMLVEMWYLWALALDGGTAAQLVHWGLGLLLALATVLFAEPLVGRRWGWLAGLTMLMIPGISNQMTAPMNDVGITLMTTLGLAAWWRTVVREEDPAWFVVGGLMFGSALAIKYVALLFLTVVAGATIYYCWKQPARRRLLVQGAIFMLIVAVCTSGVWYARAAWYRGNPVFPFFQEWLPNVDVALAPPKTVAPRPALDLVAVPWQLTMHPEVHGDRSQQLGALFLVGLPGLLILRRLRGVATLLWMSLAYALGWYWLQPNVRFLYPLLPLLCVPLVWVWREFRRLPKGPRWIAAGVMGALLCFGALIPLYRCRAHWAVACGWESKEQFLLRKEPSYAAASLANDLLGSDAHVLSQEHRAFYFQCRVTRENIYRRRTHYEQALESPAELSQQLRAAGFTHLLLAESENNRGIQYEATLSRLVAEQIAEGGEASLSCLGDYRYEDSDGAVRRYRLMMLR
jgi:hypothetical protein